MKTALSIAGSDSCGGAGIQADIKTMTMNGVYAMTAITALTAQNTTGVRAIQESTPDFLKQQIDAVFEDIYPDAVKIGMLSNTEIIYAISDFLRKRKAVNVVADTVMVSTSGHRLLAENAVSALTESIFPIACIITPNIPEAEILSDMEIKNPDQMVKSAEIIAEKFGGNVLLKGGHLESTAADLLYADGVKTWFETKKIDNPNTHGTGCTLSSAIASNLGKGMNVKESVKLAKDYVTGAIMDGLDLGRGRGPLNHMYKNII